ncbi:hypothetical protein [Nocardioides sp. Soil796]|uniref:hypothetical protein n=1 Tax=Nocardioides sp. Soil796 TaxID=1736412 RepID=UPI0007094FE8|nr:hypothetical protein [Nocardioides sp. Soil796]KRF15037.1 hypothetical protein ASH02_12385 [Nocardioides sp. Soil796]
MTPLVFFSFVSLGQAGAAEHRAYNEWHQLDHRPENLALPGVAWGDRWSRPDDFKAVSSASDEHAGTDYVAMYWFRDPVSESVRAWDQLGADSFQWGRGPIIPGVSRSLLAFFRPVRGYVNPGSLVAADVLPFRPVRGMHVQLVKHAEPMSLAVHERHTFADRVEMPRLTGLDGVAGGWTFSFDRHQQHSTLTFGADKQDARGSMRLRLLYLDGDPLETTDRIARAENELAEHEIAGHDAPGTEILLDTPVRTIIPWQDW